MTSLMTDMIQTDWRLNEITDRSSWSVRRRFNIWPGSSWTPHFGGETQNLLEGLHGPSSLWPPRGGWRSVHVQLQSALCWTLQQINVLFYFYFSMKPFNKNMNLQFVSIKSSAVGSETSSWTFSLWKNFRLTLMWFTRSSIISESSDTENILMCSFISNSLLRPRYTSFSVY